MFENLTGHGLSLAAIGGWMVGALPPIATLLAIVWYACMIMDWHAARRDKRLQKVVDTHDADDRGRAGLTSIKTEAKDNPK